MKITRAVDDSPYLQPVVDSNVKRRWPENSDTAHKSQTAAALTNATKKVTIDPRLDFLREFGSSSLSYSSLQDGMEYFLAPNYGYIAYSPIKDDIERALCLADPICSKENLEPLITMFLEKHKGAIFLHVTKETAVVLSKLGYLVNEVGVETVMRRSEVHCFRRRQGVS